MKSRRHDSQGGFAMPIKIKSQRLDILIFDNCGLGRGCSRDDSLRGRMPSKRKMLLRLSARLFNIAQLLHICVALKFIQKV